MQVAGGGRLSWMGERVFRGGIVLCLLRLVVLTDRPTCDCSCVCRLYVRE